MIGHLTESQLFVYRYRAHGVLTTKTIAGVTTTPRRCYICNNFIMLLKLKISSKGYRFQSIEETQQKFWNSETKFL